MEHVSVLKKEVNQYLDLKNGDVVVDGTLGLGGHSLEILKSIGVSGKLIAFEQDERNLAEARRRLQKHDEQVIYIHDNFRYLKTRIAGLNIKEIDAVLLDLGLSSPHVDEAGRGFSFMHDGYLDMRFDPGSELTAAKVLNNYSEQELREIFYKYGEERMAPKIAREVVKRREEQVFESTVELAEFIDSVIPMKGRHGKKVHPATRVFQALRIEVNEELKVLEEVLPQVMELLKIGGRVVIISYHSLEDRIVKHYFKDLERPEPTPEEAVYQNFGAPIVKSLTKKPVVPSEEELEANPRSRSAKLRAYEKLKNI